MRMHFAFCRNCETFSLWEPRGRPRVFAVHHRRHAEGVPQWLPQVRLQIVIILNAFLVNR